MAVGSKLIESVIQLKVMAQATIDCLESDFEAEIERFIFNTNLENGAVIESASLVFELLNPANSSERVVVALDYSENYSSLGSFLASRNSNKADHIEIITINAATEKRKEYLRTVAEDLTHVDIFLLIND